MAVSDCRPGLLRQALRFSAVVVYSLALLAMLGASAAYNCGRAAARVVWKACRPALSRARLARSTRRTSLLTSLAHGCNPDRSILYSIGAGFHLWRTLPFRNTIWHAFVVLAAGAHYAAILQGVVLPSSLP
jgi:hypothetical protein